MRGPLINDQEKRLGDEGPIPESTSHGQALFEEAIRCRGASLLELGETAGKGERPRARWRDDRRGTRQERRQVAAPLGKVTARDPEGTQGHAERQSKLRVLRRR